MSSLVTEYEGTIEPDYLVEISPGLNMLVDLFAGQIHYQMDHNGKRGKVYVTKVVSLRGENEVLHTFFTRDDKQYWLHDLTPLKGKYVSAEEWE
jgi:hypothetical protein